ncbi:hypothetical protein ACQ4N7_14270 [Nodosilinea sp. AN01ver1]|uniref:hypothetical protein n=1 Tax=Nodosilinea sp. AN01ver1 TaxID=3423362 RepID=UPI003D322F76
MTQISSSLVLGVDEFLTRYGDNPRYELADGELIDIEPTGLHETTAGKIASQLSIEIDRQGHPWIIPRTCLLRPFADAAQQYRLGEAIDSPLFPQLALRLERLCHGSLGRFWQCHRYIALASSLRIMLTACSQAWDSELAYSHRS